MTMNVRAFAEQDFPAVCRIYLEAKHDELRFEQGHFESIPLERDARILAAFRESTVIVFDDEAVLGFAAVFDQQLRALFVQRDARGRGVGHASLWPLKRAAHMTALRWAI